MSFHFCLEMSNQTSVTETKILVKLVSPQVCTMKELSFYFRLPKTVSVRQQQKTKDKQQQKYYIKSISMRKNNQNNKYFDYKKPTYSEIYIIGAYCAIVRRLS